MPVINTSKRLLSLDYLRGFFIVIIIVDHLSRWPSLFGLFSGHALLWVTAAEGFVIISGLLVGYIRGFKNRNQSLKAISIKLLKRSGILYLWVLISSYFYTAILWFIPLKGGAPKIDFDSPSDWLSLVTQTASLQSTYVWVHFLTLYAVFLAAAPIAVWMLRQGKAWLVVVVSLIFLALGWKTQIQIMQWQALFFIPSAVGYHLEDIRTWWQQLAGKRRNSIQTFVWLLTFSTIILSALCTFYPTTIGPLADNLNSLFAKDTISIYRLLTAFLWFTGYLLMFNALSKYIKKWLGWLLEPIGSHSLTAYILHGIALITVSYFTVSGDNVVINSLLGTFCILAVWAMLRIPFVLKVIPR
jgi:hypothetical protein